MLVVSLVRELAKGISMRNSKFCARKWPSRITSVEIQDQRSHNRPPKKRASPAALLRELFGGINMNMFDGPRHANLKALALHAFDHAAIASYLPDMQTLVESTLAREV